jgi:hypothetical protein
MNKPYRFPAMSGEAVKQLARAFRREGVKWEEDGYYHFEVPRKVYEHLLDDPYCVELLPHMREEAREKAIAGEGLTMFGVRITVCDE